MSRRNGMRSLVAEDLDMLPMMGLFVVLIPMLLLSAVFLELSVIDMHLPGNHAAESVTEAPNLVVRIEEDRYVVALTGRRDQVVSRREPEALERLAASLRNSGASGEGTRGLTVVSRPETRYEAIIEVMDTARETGFPDVALMGAGGEE